MSERKYITGKYEEYYNSLQGDGSVTKASNFVTEVNSIVTEFSNISSIMTYWSGEAKDAMTSNDINSILEEFKTTQENIQASLLPCCECIDYLAKALEIMKTKEDDMLQKENELADLNNSKPSETIKEDDETKHNPAYDIWKKKVEEKQTEIDALIKELDEMQEQVDLAIKTLEDLESQLKDFTNYMNMTGTILGIDEANSFSQYSLEERVKYLQDIIDNYQLIYDSLDKVMEARYGKGLTFSAEDFKNIDLIFDVFDIYWMSGVDRNSMVKSREGDATFLDIDKLTKVLSFCNSTGVFGHIESYLEGASWKDSGLQDFMFEYSKNVLKINVYDENQLKQRLKDNYGYTGDDIRSFLKSKYEVFKGTEDNKGTYTNLMETYGEYQKLASTMSVIKEKINNLKTAKKLIPFEMEMENPEFLAYMQKNYRDGSYWLLDQEKLSVMSQQEIALYDYLLHNKSVEDAASYLDAMQNAINQRVGAKRAADYIEWLKTDGFDVRDLFNSGWEGFKDGVRGFGQGLERFFTAWSIEEGEKSAFDYELMYKSQYMQQLMMDPSFINQNTNEQWHGWTDISAWYNTGSSIGNMAIPSIIGLIPGGQPLSSILFGVSIAGNSAAEAKIEGKTTAQAYLYGILTGASESITEYAFGYIPGLSAESKGFLMNLFSEGFEEFVQEYMDLGARALVFGEEIDLSGVGITEQFNKALEAGKYGVLTTGVMQVGSGSLNLAANGAVKLANKSKFNVDITVDGNPVTIDINGGNDIVSMNQTTGEVEVASFQSYGEYKNAIEAKRSIENANRVINSTLEKVNNGETLGIIEKAKLNSALNGLSVDELSQVTRAYSESDQKTIRQATEGLPSISKKTREQFEMADKFEEVANATDTLQNIEFTKDDFNETVTRDGRTLGEYIADTKSEAIDTKTRENIESISKNAMNDIDSRVENNIKLAEKQMNKEMKKEIKAAEKEMKKALKTYDDQTHSITEITMDEKVATKTQETPVNRSTNTDTINDGAIQQSSNETKTVQRTETKDSGVHTIAEASESQTQIVEQNTQTVQETNRTITEVAPASSEVNTETVTESSIERTEFVGTDGKIYENAVNLETGDVSTRVVGETQTQTQTQTEVAVEQENKTPTISVEDVKDASTAGLAFTAGMGLFGMFDGKTETDTSSQMDSGSTFTPASKTATKIDNKDTISENITEQKSDNRTTTFEDNTGTSTMTVQDPVISQDSDFDSWDGSSTDTPSSVEPSNVIKQVENEIAGVSVEELTGQLSNENYSDLKEIAESFIGSDSEQKLKILESIIPSAIQNGDVELINEIKNNVSINEYNQIVETLNRIDGKIATAFETINQDNVASFAVSQTNEINPANITAEEFVKQLNNQGNGIILNIDEIGNITDITDSQIDSSIIERHLENIKSMDHETAQRYIQALSESGTLLENPPTNISIFGDSNYEFLSNTFGESIVKTDDGSFIINSNTEVSSESMTKFIEIVQSVDQNRANIALDLVKLNPNAINSSNIELLQNDSFETLHNALGPTVFTPSFENVLTTTSVDTVVEIITSENMKPLVIDGRLSTLIENGVSILNKDFVSNFSVDEMSKLGQLVDNASQINSEFGRYRINEIINSNNDSLLHDIIKLSDIASSDNLHNGLYNIKLTSEDISKGSIYEISSIRDEVKEIMILEELIGEHITNADRVGNNSELVIDGKDGLYEFLLSKTSKLGNVYSFIDENSSLFGEDFKSKFEVLFKVDELIKNPTEQNYSLIKETLNGLDYLEQSRNMVQEIYDTITRDYTNKLRESFNGINAPSYTENGVTIYDITDQGFSMLVHTIGGNPGIGVNTSISDSLVENIANWNNTTGGNPNISTSLISNSDLTVYGKPEIILGFSDLSGHDVLSIYPHDSGSSRDTILSPNTTIFDKSHIYSMDELMHLRDEYIQSASEDSKSQVWSEIVLNRFDSNGVPIRPDYLVCFDEVNQKTIDAANILSTDGKPLPIYVIHKNAVLNSIGTTSTPAVITDYSRSNFIDFVSNDRTGAVLSLFNSDATIQQIKDNGISSIDVINDIVQNSKYVGELFQNDKFVNYFLESSKKWNFRLDSLDKQTCDTIVEQVIKQNVNSDTVVKTLNMFSEEYVSDTLDNWNYSNDILYGLLNKTDYKSIINKIVNNFDIDLTHDGVNLGRLFANAKQSNLTNQVLNPNAKAENIISIPSKLITPEVINKIWNENDVREARTIISDAAYSTDVSVLNEVIKTKELEYIKESHNTIESLRKIESLDRLSDQFYDEFDKIRDSFENSKNRDLGYSNDIDYIINSLENRITDTIIDYCFEDNSQNVIADVNELLNFYKNGHVELSPKIASLYEKVLNIDSLDFNEKMNLLNELNNNNIIEQLYDDMKTAKNIMNSEIKDKSLSQKSLEEFKNDELSEKYGVPVYTPGDQEYYAIVKTDTNKAGMDQLPTGHSFSLVSDRNTSVYGDVNDGKTFVYDSSTLNPDQIVHVFPADSFTMYRPNVFSETATDRVNKLMSIQELVKNTNGYNELLLLEQGKNQTDIDSKAPALKKMALYCVDEITEHDVQVAKEAGLGIILVKSSDKTSGNFDMWNNNYGSKQTVQSKPSSVESVSDMAASQSTSTEIINDGVTTNVGSEVIFDGTAVGVEKEINNMKYVSICIRELCKQYNCSSQEAFNKIERVIKTGIYAFVPKEGNVRAILQSIGRGDLRTTVDNMHRIENANNADVKRVEFAVKMIMEHQNYTREQALSVIKRAIDTNDLTYVTSYNGARDVLKVLNLEQLKLATQKVDISSYLKTRNAVSYNMEYGRPNVVQQIVERVDFDNRPRGLEYVFDTTGTHQTSTYGANQGVLYDLFVFRDTGTNIDYSYREALELSKRIESEHGVLPQFEKICGKEYFDFRNKMAVKYGLREADVSIIIESIDDVGACSYASVCNEIFSSFLNKEAEFERRFGFPMYTRLNGRTVFNTKELLFDMYFKVNTNTYGGALILQDRNGRYSINPNAISNKFDPLGRRIINAKEQRYLSTTNGKNTYSINNYLNEKGLEFDSSVIKPIDNQTNKYLMAETINRVMQGLRTGKVYSMGIYSTGNPVNFYAVEGGNYRSLSTSNWHEGGGHSVFVTGVTKEGFIVSSWGKKYIVSYEDLINGGKWVLTEDTIRPYNSLNNDFVRSFNSWEIGPNEIVDGVSDIVAVPSISTSNNYDSSIKSIFGKGKELLSKVISKRTSTNSQYDYSGVKERVVRKTLDGYYYSINNIGSTYDANSKTNMNTYLVSINIDGITTSKVYLSSKDIINQFNNITPYSGGQISLDDPYWINSGGLFDFFEIMEPTISKGFTEVSKPNGHLVIIEDGTTNLAGFKLNQYRVFDTTTGAAYEIRTELDAINSDIGNRLRSLWLTDKTLNKASKYDGYVGSITYNGLIKKNSEIINRIDNGLAYNTTTRVDIESALLGEKLFNAGDLTYEYISKLEKNGGENGRVSGKNLDNNMIKIINDIVASKNDGHYVLVLDDIESIKNPSILSKLDRRVIIHYDDFFTKGFFKDVDINSTIKNSFLSTYYDVDTFIRKFNNLIKIRNNLESFTNFYNSFVDDTGMKLNTKYLTSIFYQQVLDGNSDALNVMNLLAKIKQVDSSFKIVIDNNDEGGYYSSRDNIIHFSQKEINDNHFSIVFHELGHCLFDKTLGHIFPSNLRLLFDKAQINLSNNSKFLDKLSTILNDFATEATNEAEIEIFKELNKQGYKSAADYVRKLSDCLKNDQNLITDVKETIKKIMGDNYDDSIKNILDSYTEYDLADFYYDQTIRNRIIDQYKRNEDVYTQITDILDALFLGNNTTLNGKSIYSEYKHSFNYYHENGFENKDRTSNNTYDGNIKLAFDEMFANYFSMKFTTNKTAITVFRSILGDDIVDIFDQMYFDIMRY